MPGKEILFKDPWSIVIPCCNDPELYEYCCHEIECAINQLNPMYPINFFIITPEPDCAPAPHAVLDFFHPTFYITFIHIH